MAQVEARVNAMAPTAFPAPDYSEIVVERLVRLAI
jgi:hypothetical protein